MARPAKTYSRRWLAGYELPLSYKIPDELVSRLQSWLMTETGQYIAMPHDVLNVWRHDEIGKERVMLLCGVGDRQALYLMDYAKRFDRACIEFYAIGSALPLIELDNAAEVHTGCRNGFKLVYPGWRADSEQCKRDIAADREVIASVREFRHEMSKQQLQLVKEKMKKALAYRIE